MVLKRNRPHRFVKRQPSSCSRSFQACTDKRAWQWIKGKLNGMNSFWGKKKRKKKGLRLLRLIRRMTCFCVILHLFRCFFFWFQNSFWKNNCSHLLRSYDTVWVLVVKQRCCSTTGLSWFSVLLGYRSFSVNLSSFSQLNVAFFFSKFFGFTFVRQPHTDWEN